MKNQTRIIVWVISTIFLLTGCTLPGDSSAVSRSSSPLAWIDAPLDGSHFPLGAIEIVTHASAPGEVTAIQLQVDELVVAQKPPDEISGGLALANFVWQAEEAGEHLLLVSAQGEDGVWGPFASAVVTIGAEDPTLAEEPTPTTTSTPTPTGTLETTITVTPTEMTACTNRAQYVSETIPDNTVFAPGENFVKSWTLQNNGTCAWETGYNLVFVNGSQMNGSSPSSLPQVVIPGEQVTLSVDLQAPNNTGTYQGNWVLMDGDGQQFGLGADGNTAFWVKIVVEETPTITPEPTPDTQPPTIVVDYSPKGSGEPTEGQQITFTATASDNVGVAKIEIYFTASGASEANLVGTCSSTTICEITAGPFNDGPYVLTARAYDAAGNMGSTWPINVFVYAVVG